MEPNSRLWFWRPRPVPRPRARLFCFPYAGASATVYRAWLDDVPRDVELVAVQLPGRGTRYREAPMVRLQPLVEALGQALSPSDVPFAMFGHSMGGIIAFSLCRWLRACGWPAPAHLAIAACRSPRDLEGLLPAGELTDEHILSLLRRYGGTPEDIFERADLIEMLLPVFRADFELLGTYRHEPAEPLDTPLTVLGGTEDEIVQPAHLEGWREHTRGPFAVRRVDGGHFFLHTAQAQVLRVALHAFEGA